MNTAFCPALMISAPASGQGKTTVTAALARRHVQAGRRVRVFKCGPDFLDPMILERASGAPVYQLDLFMCGESECRRLLHEAAKEADLILVEGVMGLFDGKPSAADLAARFGLPVLAVIDGSAMAQTFGALAHGLASYRSDVRVVAALGNRVRSERHAQMLAESLPDGLQWVGTLPPDEEAALPERHLGLVQAAEVADLDNRIDRAAASLSDAALWLPDSVPFFAEGPQVPQKHLDGHRIAVARDAAFGFIYPANIACLEAMGAQVCYFSPLADAGLPECDALWLPGGYPELHLRPLSENRAMKTAIKAHHAAGKAILAECGGMLYCLDTLDDGKGCALPMLGLMPGSATIQPRLAALGLQALDLPEGTLRGHTFHYSRLNTALAPQWRARSPEGAIGESMFRHGPLWASYVHGYFPSASVAVAAMFKAG
ncbi:MAG: cobyrinic acid a,c-diamide synthase [Novosphingobium sp. 17-62-19]|uniref:cobyrinate a,c-diamide synthase n=1 Tax=Novosphingobium sp. 17-62-19 TaxID=1970406 RepID=UPI000BC4B2A2|nr:cobyrinate a,c-diamide synthase [Novosphingobium sp. 17-62-19]OYX96424.1 MAG: cobyrinic acid a,c-diamide synthase [Novosphingobium sp. 35-62-5]OZA19156.1 MAG: cobyrinic acid a,c-diamide synthase [Novosphingobium sp. 17-62-19]HQS97279.1 cobyrinate a,c-diamide synthase [Novosphingobium sp.]